MSEVKPRVDPETMAIREIASHDVVAIPPSTTLAAAAATMAGHRISCVVVAEGPCPVGIVTERDIVLAFGRPDAATTSVSANMSSPLVRVGVDVTLAEAHRTAARHGIRHLVLVDGAGRLAGIVTPTDFRRLELLLVRGGDRVANKMTGVLAMPPQTPLDRAVGVMAERRRTCIVVTREERPVGIVTERDLVRIFARGPAASTLADVMAAPLVTVSVETPLGEAAEAMLLHGYRHLPVVDRTGRLAGLLEQTQLLDATALGALDPLVERERALLTVVLANLTEPVWMKDAHGRYVVANERFAELLGLPPTAILGSHPELLGDVAVAVDRREDDAAARSGEPFRRVVRLRDTQSRRAFSLDVIKTALRDTRGNVLGVVGVAQDRTERESLTERLQERTKELRCLYEIVRATESVDDPEPQVFARVLELLPQGYRWPGQARVRISIGDRVYAFGFVASEHVQAATATVPDDRTLRVEVSYQPPLPTDDSSPFLPEEQDMLDATAARLATHVARRSATERQRSFAAVLANSHEGILLVDASTLRIIDANEAAARDLGYVTRELIGRRLSDFEVPGRPSRLDDLAGRVRAAGRLEFETEHRDRGGRTRYVVVTIAALESGGRSRLVVTVRDVTERRRSQDAARSAQDFRQAVMDSVPGLFLVVDDQGVVVTNNRGIEAFVGVEEGALLGRPVLELLSADDWTKVRDLGEAAHGGVTSPVEAWVQRSDGERVPLEFAGTGLEVDGRRLVVTTGVDVSERRRVAAALAAHQQQLEAAVQARTRELEAVNAELRRKDERLEALLRLFEEAERLTERQLLERAVREAARLTGSVAGHLRIPDDTASVLRLRATTLGQEGSPADLPIDTPPWGPAFQSRAAVLRNDRLTLLDEGGEVARCMCVPIIEDGAVTLLLCVSNKRSDYGDSDLQQLEFIGVGLTRILARRRVELALAQAKEEADRASQAKTSFLANMSHEIRTPMNAIVGFAHLIRRDPLTPRQQAQLTKVTESAQHLLSLISDILDFSRIEAGKLTLEDQWFDLDGVFDNVVRLVGDQAAAKGVEIVVDLGGLPATMRGDGLRLGQVLLNFASNSVKFTQHGLVCLRASATALAGRPHVRFEVEDTGIGLSPEQQARIFDAFEQADASTTRRFGGTGLGLAICKRIVEEMAGRIGVESVAGRGSTFWFEIPQGEAPPPRPRLAPTLVRDRRALVADDCVEALGVLAELLTELGFRTARATSGEAALNAVEEADQQGQPFDLVFLDLRMPGLDGLATAARLSELPLRAPPHWTVLTAFAETVGADAAGRAHVKYVLPKPVTPSALLVAVQDLLGGQTRRPAPRVGGDGERALQLHHGARVLVAEDDPINREVAVELLRNVGLAVDAVVDGQQAVERARTNRYEAILMDVQMPIMDGLAATRAIRAVPGLERIPIIAMTAHAFEQDRKDTRAAGMNDHVVKPFEPERLYSTLARCLPKRRGSTPRLHNVVPWDRRLGGIPGTGPPPPEQEALRARLVGVAELEVGAALDRLRGDVRMYARLLHAFLERHAGDGPPLRALVATDEWEAITGAAHTLKGSAGNLGARQVEAHARELEAASRARDAAGCAAAIDALEVEVKMLSSSVHLVLPAEQPGPEAPVDWVAARRVVRDLERLLAADDTAASDLLGESRAVLAGALGDAFAAVARKVEGFDFPAALLLVHAAVETEPRLR